ncbi:MAG: rhodanese-like domain-containing protein [Planctomycetota bacterium]|nr:MAG: rhodanese-like domain-containing protein [Planctomycetota bacterium]
MDWIAVAALVTALVALLVALAARSKAAGIAQAAADAKTDARRLASGAAEEIEHRVAELRQLLVLVRKGAPLTDEMIRDGQLWFDVTPDEGKQLVVAERVRVLDVRTPQETSTGVIPGALLIPVQELPERLKELPRDGKKTLVYCAGGGRSAAACEMLTKEGFANLHNLTGGMGAWSGPVERR